MAGGREHLFDNARVFLIIAVIIGHLDTGPQWMTYNHVLNNFIYDWHMQALAIISGHLAFGKDTYPMLGAALRRYFIPFLVMQLAYGAVCGWLGVGWSLFFPFGALWYLESLATWYVLVAGAKWLKSRFSPPVVPPVIWVAASIVFALITAQRVAKVNLFSLRETIGFFPYFLVGYFLKRGFFLELSSRKYSAALFLIILFIGEAYGLARPQTLPLTPSLLIRYAAGFAGAFALLSLMPKNEVWIGRNPDLKEWWRTIFRKNRETSAARPASGLNLTAFSAYTMYPYVLHQFFTVSILSIYSREKPFWDAIDDGLGHGLRRLQSFFSSLITGGGIPSGQSFTEEVFHIWGTFPFRIAVVLLAIALFFLLSSNFVRRTLRTHLIVEPKWIFDRLERESLLKSHPRIRGIVSRVMASIRMGR